MNKKIYPSILSLIIIILFVFIFLISTAYKRTNIFDGQRALENVKYQVKLGPRIPGSEAHEKVTEWIISSLKKNKWNIEIQETEVNGVPIKNIIAKTGMGTPWIIIASHYDSRIFADRDETPVGRSSAVDGANDGASSTAILLEIARTLPNTINKQIWLVFFDAEDNGNIPGYDWSLGSQYFVNKLVGKPDSVVILDMVGDKDLNIYMEKNSNPDLNQEIWTSASELGYKQFIPTYKYDLIDDHIPFIQAGIRAVDVIDFDYPYWHTTNDSLDKISADSLKVIGETILRWLEQYPRNSTK
jgi:Zn-dependent M28 family amino/carboxypeptidase